MLDPRHHFTLSQHEARIEQVLEAYTRLNEGLGSQDERPVNDNKIMNDQSKKFVGETSKTHVAILKCDECSCAINDCITSRNSLSVRQHKFSFFAF